MYNKSMKKKYDIISIGSAMRDIFILNKDLKYPVKALDPFDKNVVGNKIALKDIYFDIGGGGSNTAATLSNMGLKVGLFSRIGKDLAGKEIIKTMKSFKVDTKMIEVDRKEETGYSVIFINKEGDRTTLTFRGAADFNDTTKVPTKKLVSDWFFVTSVNGNFRMLKNLFDLGHGNNTKIAWNPGNAEFELSKAKMVSLLKRVDVLFLNLDEARRLTKSRTKNIKTIMSKLELLAPYSILCVTGGKAGAWVKKDHEFYWSPILPKKVVNATGAGDAFGSGFVAGLHLYDGDLKKSLQLGMLNSNSVVTKMGAKHGLLKKPPTIKSLNIIKVKKIK
jgi:sugar/nucleoside kinase (ribokinase family)